MELPEIDGDEVITFDWDDDMLDALDNTDDDNMFKNTTVDATRLDSGELDVDYISSKSAIFVEKLEAAVDNPG